MFVARKIVTSECASVRDDTNFLVRVCSGIFIIIIIIIISSSSHNQYEVRIKSCHATCADASSLSIMVMAGSAKVPKV